ncbi:MAG: TIGR00730 family Rossman fold protein [Deferribacteres bacterium]|nr:TIGR00730 family Rossman fold protein [Deferribacteres bacterium]
MNKKEQKLIEELKAQQGDVWRIFRILAEFIQGFDALADIGPAVTFFGSSRFTSRNRYYKLARKTAYMLGKEGFTIITGGGPGIMEAANRGAYEAGVTSVGLNIEIPHEQEKNPYQTLSLKFKYFFVRKVMLLRYALAYVIFPGGFGTFDELFEAATLIQTERIFPFPVILFGTDYWMDIYDFMRKKMVKVGTIDKEDLSIFHLTDEPEEVVNIIKDEVKNKLNILENQDLLPEVKEALRKFIEN